MPLVSSCRGQWKQLSNSKLIALACRSADGLLVGLQGVESDLASPEEEALCRLL